MLICFENNIIGYNMILFKYIMNNASAIINYM